MKPYLSLFFVLIATIARAQTPVWSQVPNSPGTNSVRHDDIYFTDPTNGWATHNNNIYRTTNGGLTWTTNLTLANTHFILGDLFALPAEFASAFDAVFEHTCFCAIPRERRDDYVQAVAKALKPGGLLLALFYLTPRDNPDPTLGPPFNASLDELDTRFAEHFTLLRSETPTVAFPGRENREVLRLYQRRGD